jgi:hypothetical protein
MQNFFSSIYKTTHTDGYQLLGLYSAAQQFEVYGINTKVLRTAIFSHIRTHYTLDNSHWEETYNSLVLLVESEKNVV